MCSSKTPPEGMGYLWKICFRIEPGRTGAERRRRKLACESLLFASGLWGESPTTDEAPKVVQRLPPGGVEGRERKEGRIWELAHRCALLWSMLWGESPATAEAPKAVHRLRPGGAAGRDRSRTNKIA